MLAPVTDIAFSLDASTLVVVATCITTLLGMFLLFVSKRDSVRALAWWGAAYIIGGFSVALWSHSSGSEGSMSASLPHALLFIACGMMWSAARLFHGRNVRWIAMFAGGAIWLLAAKLGSFAEAPNDRIVLSALIVATYTFLTALEL